MMFHLNQYLFLLVIAFTNSLPLIFPNTAFTLGQLTITGEKSTVNDRYRPDCRPTLSYIHTRQPTNPRSMPTNFYGLVGYDRVKNYPL